MSRVGVAKEPVMPAKRGDSGKSRIPGNGGSPKKGDSGKGKKVSAKLGRPDKGRSGRAGRGDNGGEEEEDDERRGPPPKQGMTGGKAFLLCTPALMILLLVFGWKLATMEEKPDKPLKIEINYNDLIESAETKYRKAKACY